MVRKLQGRFLVLCIVVFVLVTSVVGVVGAQATPMTSDDYLASAKTLADDWNLMPLVTVVAIVAITAMLIKRAKSAAR